MAYASAAGWGNLPNGNWSPVVYSKKVLMSLKKSSVADDITNTDFAGEIKGMGDTVRILKQPIVTVKTLVRGTKIEPQDIVDEDITMSVDQGAYYAYQLDDIEQAFTHVNWMDMAADAAAYALKDNYDLNILNYMQTQVSVANSVGTNVAPVTIGFGPNNDFSPIDLISRLAKILNQRNIPWEDRFLVASPDFFEALRREDSKLIEVQVTGDSKSPVLNAKGLYTMKIHGFSLYESNNAPTSGGYNVILAGHRGSTATATSLLNNETLRSQEVFADITRGKMVWGRKTLRTEALVQAYVDIRDV